MIVFCQKCQASYNIADKLIGAKGRKVKCAKCGYTWTQTLYAEEKNNDKKSNVNEEQTLQAEQFQEQEEIKSKGLNWIVEESTIKKEDNVKKIKENREQEINSLKESNEEDNEQNSDKSLETIEENIEINLKFLQEEPEIYDIPELPKDEVALLIDKNKKALKKRLKLILTVIIISIIWFGRFQIVKHFSPARYFYDFWHINSVKVGEGLEFRNVTRKNIYENDKLFLEIRGYVFNVSIEDRVVHNIEIQLYDENGNFLQKENFEPNILKLKPTFSVPFVIKLPSPPEKTAYIVTTFKERR